MQRIKLFVSWLVNGTFAIGTFIVLPSISLARGGDPAAMCDRAAAQIAQETDVPLDVLRAITRTETGRGANAEMRPWPWTVNMEGRGVWFDSEAQAQGYVFRHFRSGARSFDIGCFQINYKWHGHAFANIEDMFDPVLNARYAASFLAKLYGEHGDWSRAVGAYHSRTQKYAARYLQKYEEVRRAMPTSAQAPHEGNRFPLLVGGGGQGRSGSLVPRTQGTAGALITPRRGG